MMPAYKVTFRCYEGPRQRRPISEAEFIQVAEFSYIPAEMSKEFKSTESFHYWAAPIIKPYLGQFNQPWESNLLAVNLFPVQSYSLYNLIVCRFCNWSGCNECCHHRFPRNGGVGSLGARARGVYRGCAKKMHMSAVHINQNDRV